jgi:hypothetical protein
MWYIGIRYNRDMFNDQGTADVFAGIINNSKVARKACPSNLHARSLSEYAHCPLEPPVPPNTSLPSIVETFGSESVNVHTPTGS